MGRVYSLPIAFVAQTAAVDFAEIVVPSTLVVVLHEVRITQSTEVGDAQAEMLRFSIKRGIGSTSGSGGTTPTPVRQNTGDATATTTNEVNNTTQAVAGGGTLTTILNVAEHVANGFHYLPTPETRLVFSPAQSIIVSLDAAPADSVTLGGYVIFEELGG